MYGSPRILLLLFALTVRFLLKISFSFFSPLKRHILEIPAKWKHCQMVHDLLLVV